MSYFHLSFIYFGILFFNLTFSSELTSKNNLIVSCEKLVAKKQPKVGTKCISNSGVMLERQNHPMAGLGWRDLSTNLFWSEKIGSETNNLTLARDFCSSKGLRLPRMNDDISDGINEINQAIYNGIFSVLYPFSIKSNLAKYFGDTLYWSSTIKREKNHVYTYLLYYRFFKKEYIKYTLYEFENNQIITDNTKYVYAYSLCTGRF